MTTRSSRRLFDNGDFHSITICPAEELTFFNYLDNGNKNKLFEGLHCSCCTVSR